MQNIRLSKDHCSVIILDQTRLPNEETYCTLRTRRELFDAIYTLQVRGAPAIGIFAAFALYILASDIKTDNYAAFDQAFDEAVAYLKTARPTAVNLFWAAKRMRNIVKSNAGVSVIEIVDLLKKEALRIQQEDIAMCRAIAEHGLRLLKDGSRILTHCNAGPLATSRYGTALGPILLGKERGLHFKVYADETRPLLQGARITTYELSCAGIDVTLICDNMAAAVMQRGLVDAVFVGCDRVAANGDVANKIGTSGLAVLASHYKIPFYVLGPSSTIDISCPNGDHIDIEERDGAEICEQYFTQRMAPEGVRCYNPAFDVTDNALITGIVTEHGILTAPYTEQIQALFHRQEAH